MTQDRADEFLERIVAALKDFRFDGQTQKAADLFDIEFSDINTPVNVFQATVTIKARRKGKAGSAPTTVTLDAKWNGVVFRITIINGADAKEYNRQFPSIHHGIQVSPGTTLDRGESTEVVLPDQVEPFCEHFYYSVLDAKDSPLSPSA